MRKTLLTIAYDFPPAVAGTKRTVKFVKYLPEFGWQALVLTVKPVWTWGRDSSLLEEIAGKTVDIRRTGSLDPYRLRYLCEVRSSARGADHVDKEATASGAGDRKTMRFLRRWCFVPDDRMLWVPFACAEAMRILLRHRIDAVYTTSYPNSAHLVGCFAKEFYRLPWIADFRDGWTQNPQFFDPPTPAHRAANRFLERRVVRSSDAVTAVSEPITRHLQSLDPFCSEKAVTLPNGFDEEDFAGIEPEQRDGFSITYAGTLFGTRTPVPFIRAVEELVREDDELARDLRVRFICPPGTAPLNDALNGVSEQTRAAVHQEKFLPLKQCLREMMSSSVLLLILEKGPNSEIMLTQKVFEYLAARRPILALVPEGACKNLLTSLSVGEIVEPDDVEGIKRALRRLYRAWQSDSLAPHNADLAPFTRRELARRLAAILDEMT